MIPRFGDNDGPDKQYNLLRRPAVNADDVIHRGRAFSAKLWELTSDYVDSDLPDKATRQFHQCFWEMYVAAAMHDLSLPLVPRAMRKSPNAGPDLQIGPNVWIEAIAVTAGTGPDAIVRPPGGFTSVPEEKIKLRLLSGLTEKRNKFDGYRKNGLVGKDDICVVAINDALAYGLSFEWDLPRIVRSVMGRRARPGVRPADARSHRAHQRAPGSRHEAIREQSRPRASSATAPATLSARASTAWRAFISIAKYLAAISSLSTIRRPRPLCAEHS